MTGLAGATGRNGPVDDAPPARGSAGGTLPCERRRADLWCALVIASGVAVTCALVWGQPRRVAFLVPPFTLTLLAVWGGARAWRPAAQIAAVAVAVGVCVFPLTRPQLRIAGQEAGRPDSDLLWTAALQDAGQSIIRRQPITARSGYVLRVRYVWHPGAPGAPGAPGGGTAEPYVMAKVNGIALELRSAAPAETDDCCELRWPVPAAATLAGGIAEIEVRQAARDPRVRFIVQGKSSPAALGREGTAFFDGLERRPGMVHTHSGTVREAFAHIWLEVP